ncbi:PREDICTED: THAP domain-containing protein 2-like [Trachymyrmex cornetzi]|uniref:THAP domain-containing protein 2-like n=1 Tax=Trachymyrmex cornetzi TaxID=471704 RepID=UPI00084F77CC|nr:PREDICTED: THAP domain-containing protein 2-like [Trachymyrmex cornetzi]
MKKKWLHTIGRENWEPKQYSAVCEVHFAKEMWEKVRQDGKRKLKIQAVPTIFPACEELYETTTESSNEPKTKKLKSDKDYNEISKGFSSIKENHFQFATIENINNKTSDKSTNIEEHLEATSSIFNVTPVSLEHALAEIKILQQELQNKDTEIIQLQEKLDNIDKIFRTVDRSNKTLTKRIRKLRSIESNLRKYSTEQMAMIRNITLPILKKLSSFSFEKTEVNTKIIQLFKTTKDFLRQNPNVILTKADKGNITVALNKNDYRSKVLQMLEDKETYVKL